MTTKVVFLFCGSFNPLTRAHIKLLKWGKEWAESQFERHRVVKAIISPVNDLYSVKRKNLVPAKHRISMINLAIQEEGVNWIECNSWESDQKDWQRTLSVLKYHQRRCDNDYSEKVNLWMVSGGDLIESIAVPGLWQDEDLEAIFSNYKILVFPRAPSDPVSFIKRHHILSKHEKNIFYANKWVPNEDSSTKAREAISQGSYPSNLLHSSVINYIKDTHLYAC